VARHLEHGRGAEQLAARYLIRQGLVLVTSNHQARVGELDLVMRDGRTLVIVEVRSRISVQVATPAETVDRHKRRRIILATQHFILRNRCYREWPIRFDVIGITGELDAAQIKWIRAAFTLDDMASR
jgi:putative endonuclease